MVYEAEGFSKTAARKDTWENFIDNYIFPERTYVQESEEKTPNGKELLEKVDASSVSVATRETVNKQREAIASTTFKEEVFEDRKNKKDNIEDLYTTKEIKQEEEEGEELTEVGKIKESKVTDLNQKIQL